MTLMTALAARVAEAPGVGRVRAGVRVGRAGEGEVGVEVEAADAGRGAGRGVGRAVVGDVVRGDVDDRAGRADRVADGAGGGVVVAARVAAAPGVGGVRAGVRVGRAGEGEVGVEV